MVEVYYPPPRSMIYPVIIQLARFYLLLLKMPQAFKRPRFHAQRQAALKRRRLGAARRMGGAHVVRRGRFAGRIHRGSEWKFHDTLITPTAMAATGVFVTNGSLCEIPQGVEESERIGRKVVVRTISVKCKMRLATSTTATGNNMYRLIFYVDHQCNGATATALDILEQDDLLSFRNLANRSRFDIIYDETKVMNPTAAAGNGTANDFGEVFHYKEFDMPVNIPLEFDNSAATGAIATIRSNNIGLMLIMQDATEVVNFTGTVRLRFTD